MPTSFRQLDSKFGEIYTAWKSKCSEFGAGFFSYLSTQRDVVMYVENRFVSLMQGLESFHRTKYGSQSTIPSKLAIKIERILGQVSTAGDKKWLSKKLEHSAEITLAERIVEIARALPFDIEIDGLQTFAKECANIRNDLAHFGGQRTRKNNSDYLIEINSKSEVLEFFYQTTLLREIGIDDQIIRRMLYQGFHSYKLKSILVEENLLSNEVLKPTSSEVRQLNETAKRATL